MHWYLCGKIYDFLVFVLQDRGIELHHGRTSKISSSAVTLNYRKCAVVGYGKDFLSCS